MTTPFTMTSPNIATIYPVGSLITSYDVLRLDQYYVIGFSGRDCVHLRPHDWLDRLMDAVWVWWRMLRP